MPPEVFDDDDDLSPDEQRLFRFQHEHKTRLRAAQLGVDMNQWVHYDPAGKEIIEHAIDTVHNSMLQLIDTPLSSPQALELQVEARAAKRLIDQVIQVLERGEQAVIELEGEEYDHEHEE